MSKHTEGPHPWLTEIQARIPCEVCAVRYYRPPAGKGVSGDVQFIPTKLRVVHNSLDITIGPVVESKHKGIARCLVSIRNPWQCETLSNLSEVLEWAQTFAS